jgi:hypothetical protein
MYLIVWDDSSVSKFAGSELPRTLLDANKVDEVTIIRHTPAQGFEQLERDNHTWRDFPDYGLSALAQCSGDDDDDECEVDDSWQDGEDE